MGKGRKATVASTDKLEEPAPAAHKASERRLSLVIMCRNEEARIATALRSAKSIADEVVIYDTGSTDSTIEKVFEVCPEAKVYTGKFVNFVESYNAALDHVRTSHVLMLAADESFASQEGALAVRRYFDSGGNMLDMTVKDFDPAGRYLSEMVRNRLFPSSKRYAGPYTHEYIPVGSGERVDLMPSVHHIHHCPGKTKEQERTRMEQDIVVLKQYIEDNRKSLGPDIIRANFYLHKSYTILQQYEEAKQYADLVRAFLSGQNHMFVNQIDFDESHTAYEKSQDLDVWRRTTLRNPSCPALSAMYGMTALEAGDFETAKIALKRAIALPRNVQTKLLADNPALYLDFPLGALAEMAHREGNILETSMYLSILTSVNPAYCEQLRNKLTSVINW